jgi:class 3 adenylate cyclase
MTYPHRLLDDVKTLAGFKGWAEDVYQDFFKLQCGKMTEAEFSAKYYRKRAILSIDMTGFTSSAMRRGELQSLLRILDAQRVAIPVMQDFGAELIRCFADDIVALFDEPNVAIDTAFEIHRRVQLFNKSPLASSHPTQCCAGIGYGQVFAIGPNLAQGDEMNRASKLGEDIARANETLITERAHAAVADRDDISFKLQDLDDQLFPFYRATPNIS